MSDRLWEMLSAWRAGVDEDVDDVAARWRAALADGDGDVVEAWHADRRRVECRAVSAAWRRAAEDGDVSRAMAVRHRLGERMLAQMRAEAAGGPAMGYAAAVEYAEGLAVPEAARAVAGRLAESMLTPGGGVR